MKPALLIIFLLFPLASFSEEISKEQSISIAEKFILENGYTDAPSKKIKRKLDGESIEWDSKREKILKNRFNSLNKKAIGIKAGRKGQEQGWSVAFDYVNTQYSSSCRVVTMNVDGSNIRLEHVDGKREYFIGF